MHITNHKLLFVPLIASMLSACNSLVKEVTPNGVPRTERKLVVHCYIAPEDTALVATVAVSSPVLGKSSKQNERRANATITLSDGNQSINLPFDNQRSFYWANAKSLPIQAGHTYTLTVSLPEGLKVRATTTVPGPVPITEVRFDSVTKRNVSEIEYSMSLRWHDPVNVLNYYRVAGESTLFQLVRRIPGPDKPVKIDTMGLSRYPIDFIRSLQIDQDQNGQLMVSSKGRITLYRNNQLTRLSTTLYLLNVDEAYYRYHEALARQRNIEDNPFAEPVLVPTNIEGGLGCFGSYSRSKKTISF